MSSICPWVYVDGRFTSADSARISPLDRGFLFGDAAYEVTAVLGGRLIDDSQHMRRLARTLKGLHFADFPDTSDLLAMQDELIVRNGLDEGIVYLQVSRGSFPVRDFAPAGVAKPTIFAFAQTMTLFGSGRDRSGIRVITSEDLRWRRRDLKTTSLLAQCLAKMAALEAGADDVWMIEGGMITEGSSANAWIVTEAGVVVTRQLSRDILAGVTRAGVLDFAGDTRIEERPFSVSEAHQAAEAFNTSSSKAILPVVEIDGHRIGDGTPGSVTCALRDRYLAVVRAEE